MEITRVHDEELRQMANEQGPMSPPANVLHRLREKRAKDHQVFVWKVGDYCFIGPAPDAETEMAMIDLAEADDTDEYEVEV